MNPNSEIQSLSDFNQIAESESIFSRFSEVSRETSSLVADYWYSFSYLMPTLLVQASNNLVRAHERKTLLDIAKEERGEVDGTPHFKMFANACNQINIFPRMLDLAILEELADFSLKSDNHKTLGLCFGLEVIANENIEFLFHNLCNEHLDGKVLSETDFFKIHRLNEDTHIAMNFKNYSMYCQSVQDKESFMMGFKFALSFWKTFWAQALDSSMERHELIS